MGLTARTAASFCVFLTLETATFFAVAFFTAGFGAAFFALTADFAFAAAFFAGRSFTDLRAGALDAVALLALGLEADFAFTARFPVLAAGLAFDRDVDRLKPFVRLLLMGGISKGCSLSASSRWKRPELTTEVPLNQRAQVFAGALSS